MEFPHGEERFEGWKAYSALTISNEARLGEDEKKL
jgi:hypothetical protein